MTESSSNFTDFNLLEYLRECFKPILAEKKKLLKKKSKKLLRIKISRVVPSSDKKGLSKDVFGSQDYNARVLILEKQRHSNLHSVLDYYRSILKVADLLTLHSGKALYSRTRGKLKESKKAMKTRINSSGEFLVISEKIKNLENSACSDLAAGRTIFTARNASTEKMSDANKRLAYLYEGFLKGGSDKSEALNKFRIPFLNIPESSVTLSDPFKTLISKVSKRSGYKSKYMSLTNAFLKRLPKKYR